MASGNDMTRFICLFHHADRARAAVRALQQLSLGDGMVQTVGDSEDATGLVGSQTLTDLGVPERDLEHLQEGLRHGGVVVSLEAPESQSDAVEKIFHRFSADKIDEADLRADITNDSQAPLAAAGAATAAVVPAPAKDEVVLPVAREELQVGKREVERGGVRVLRRTVEEPVSQDVSLHGERVVLGYREVNRPVTDADIQAGSQSIELVETAEVPVVQKVARVVEEVHVGKVESEHTEVVQDTLRHTEIDVENLDGLRGEGQNARSSDPGLHTENLRRD